MRQAVLANAAALIGGLFALSPALTPLSAQAAAACSPDQNKPKELALATLLLSKASSQPVGPTRAATLNQIAKDLLDKPDKFTSNPGGYNYMLSQLYELMAQQPNGVAPTTRGAIGLTTRPGDQFDVIAELDSAYTRMVTALPVCAKDIESSRASQAFVAVTTKAYAASQEGKEDTAKYYANRSLMLAPNNPFPHYILATVAQNKNDMPTAVTHWKDVVRLAGTDSTFKDIKLTSLFYLGVEDLSAAASKTGDAQKTQARQAAEYLKEFLASNPTSGDAPNVMNNLSQAYQLAGDTASARGIYTDMLANPSKYSDAILAAGGIIATQTGDQANAAKLFDEATKLNPRARDALYNLAATRYTLKEYEGMYEPLRMLREVDPNNYDGLMYFAFAAQEMQKNAKTPELKKAWSDTLIKYSDIAEKLPAKVQISSFNRGIDKADVTISVEQAAAAAGNYTITMEFLDKSGAVVSSDTQKVGPIAKGERKSVTFSGKGAGIVGFRYKALS